MTANPRHSPSRRNAALLVAAAVCAAAFVVIALAVLAGETVGFDRAVHAGIRHLNSPTADGLMRGLSFIGSAPAIVAVVAAAFAWTVRRGTPAVGVVLAAFALGAEGINLLLKTLFQRARPDLLAATALSAGYSFPSGHAMIAVAAYGLTAAVAVRLRPGSRKALAVATPVLVLLIGLSRIYLDLHFASDVLAGFAAGGTVLATGLLALGTVAPPPVSISTP